MDTSAIQKCINHIRCEDTKYADKVADGADAQLSALLARLEEDEKLINDSEIIIRDGDEFGVARVVWLQDKSLWMKKGKNE